MPGIIGRKIGMTSVYSAEGKNSMHSDRSWSLCSNSSSNRRQRWLRGCSIRFGDVKEKNTPKLMKGHFKKAKTDSKSELVEFNGFEDVKSRRCY